MAKLIVGVNDLLTWCLNNGEWGRRLIDEWISLDEFNNPIQMDKVTSGSGRKVQWQCCNGHRWTAMIYKRATLKTGCPYCSGHKVSSENSLLAWCQNNGEYGQQLISEFSVKIKVLSEN